MITTVEVASSSGEGARIVDLIHDALVRKAGKKKRTVSMRCLIISVFLGVCAGLAVGLLVAP